MSTQPLPEHDAEQNALPSVGPDVQHSEAVSPRADVESAVARFWETVRKSADVIVTLRQENAMVNAQNVAFRRSEQELQNRVDELLLRITTLERQIPGAIATDVSDQTSSSASVDARVSEMQRSIDRTEDELKAMRESMDLQAEELVQRTAIIAQRDEVISQMKVALSETEAKLVEAHEHLADNSEISKQLEDVRAELVARTAQLQKVQDSFDGGSRPSLEGEALEARLHELELAASNYNDSVNRIAELEEEVEDLRQQLDQAMEIVNTYRAAGLRHIEDPELKDQMTLFNPQGIGQTASVASTPQLMTEEELAALAVRLDNVADRVAQLLGIS
ncbi:MAG: hypothetical protein NTX15_00115 [Candidatus Kapabacteria bacterium]|nr:hypothetical protein [Candidatus Kapabacteria bacterium]